MREDAVGSEALQRSVAKEIFDSVHAMVDPCAGRTSSNRGLAWLIDVFLVSLSKAVTIIQSVFK